MAKVAVVYYASKTDSKIEKFSKALAEGLQEQGDTVGVFNLRLADDFRAALYEYVCFGSEAESFFSSKIPASFGKRLEQLSNLEGKRAMAFSEKKLFFPVKLSNRLMKIVESQGVFLRNTAIFDSVEEAKLFGTKLITSKKV